MKWERRFFVLFNMLPKRLREEYVNNYILDDWHKICACGFVIHKEGMEEEE
jgi:hypothetical protein